MDLFEFEVRYRSYHWLLHYLHLDVDQEQLLKLITITNQGQLTKKLTETLPQELQQLTLDTYTDFKKKFIEIYWSTAVPETTYCVADYIQRLEYEMKVIKEMGFNEYLLIVQDFIARARTNGIAVWPWRGSAAWSLLCFCIGITDVDPLPYGLLFERFLNPARISMPDVDIDFEDTQREQVVEYVKKKYGETRVSNIWTYMKLASKAAFKDVARALGVPFDRANAISNMIPDKVSLKDLKTAETTPDELKSLLEQDDLIASVFDLAASLEWNIRQVWVHACGIIIAPDDVVKFASVQYPVKPVWGQDQTLVTQLDGKNLEKIGLLKMDFLGLRNLSIIKNTCKILKAKSEREGKALTPLFANFFDTMLFHPPLDDMNTYERILQKGDTSGVFQFEWEGIRHFLTQLKPTNINDIVAMGALYRPGPMEFIPNYIHRKHWEEPVIYMSQELHDTLVQLYGEDVAKEEKKKLEEDLAPFCDVTYGIVVYQEQIMQMVQSMGGFSLAEADTLRRWVGKKIKEEIERIKGIFVEKAAEFRNYKKETTTYVYEKMVEPAALYSFNKSHAVAYAMISFQTAYLKANYPLEFYAALLRSVEDDTDKLSKFINEVLHHGMLVKVPSVNESFNHIAAIDDYIRLWFFCVKGVGSDVGEYIQKVRETWGKFASLEDFLLRCEKVVNKKSLESLTKAGAFDDFGERAQLLENVQLMIDRVKHAPSSSAWLFGEQMRADLKLKVVPPADTMTRLLMENDAFKCFVSGHPFDGLYQYLKKYNFLSTMLGNENFGQFKMICYIKDIQRAKKKWFFVALEDISGQCEIFFKDTLTFHKFDMLIITGYKAKSFRIQKIVKTTLDQLLRDAQRAGKYRPEENVRMIKEIRSASWVEKWRMKNEEVVLGSEVNMDHAGEEQTELEETKVVLRTKFMLPADIKKIQQMVEMIKKHPGDIQVSVGDKVFQVSQEGLESLQEIL